MCLSLLDNDQIQELKKKKSLCVKGASGCRQLTSLPSRLIDASVLLTSYQVHLCLIVYICLLRGRPFTFFSCLTPLLLTIILGADDADEHHIVQMNTNIVQMNTI